MDEPIGFPAPPSVPSLGSAALSSAAPTPPSVPSLDSAALSSAAPVVGATTAPPRHWGQASSEAARSNARKSGNRHPAKLAPVTAVPPRISERERWALQRRVDLALSSTPASGAGPPSADELQLLAADLARAGETAALVRIWDLSGGSAAASESTWEALEALHARGKRRIPRGTLQLPDLDRRTLNPARRLHKIAKGRIYKNRSNAAHECLDDALAWLEKQRASGRRITGKKRMKLAREFAKELDVPLETGRGLVTKLKQKRLLDKVEDLGSPVGARKKRARQVSKPL